MRLIDADVLITWFNDHYDDEEFSVGYISGLIKDAPTIEPQQAIRDAYKHGKSKGIKRGMAIARRKCALKLISDQESNNIKP